MKSAVPPALPIPAIEGTVARQAHVDLPAGTYEHEFGRDGFDGPVTHLYHRHPPTAWISWEGPLRPRAFDTSRLARRTSDPWDADLLLANPDVKFRLWRCTETMPDLARNADGDELIFIHAGSGTLLCDFGQLAFGEGDYLLLPRSTTWRIEPNSEVMALLIEASASAFRLPDKGLLGAHALFDPAVAERPRIDTTFLSRPRDGIRRVRIKRQDRVSTVTFPHDPLDAIGWKGDLAPLRLNWRDIRPITSHRYHLPPSVHTTFLTDQVIVCTFVPRPIETDPAALKLPFFHSNVDYDEVNFLHAGRSLSRDGIRPGMFWLHPAGFPHGPHPAARHAAQLPRAAMTDEVAVTLETRKPLEVASGAAAIEWPGYVDSWRELQP